MNVMVCALAFCGCDSFAYWILNIQKLSHQPMRCQAFLLISNKLLQLSEHRWFPAKAKWAKKIYNKRKQFFSKLGEINHVCYKMISVWTPSEELTQNRKWNFHLNFIYRISISNLHYYMCWNGNKTKKNIIIHRSLILCW